LNKKSFFICALVAVLGLNQSGNSQTNLVDTQLIKAIFDGDIAKRINAGQQIVYADKPSGATQKLKEKIMNDKTLKIALTNEERRFIIDALDSIGNYSWPDNLFNNSKRINNKDVFATAAWVDDGRNKQRRFVYVFSKPIYIRNNSVALISYARICGGECGSTETAFYKRVDGIWVVDIIISGGDF